MPRPNLDSSNKRRKVYVWWGFSALFMFPMAFIFKGEWVIGFLIFLIFVFTYFKNKDIQRFRRNIEYFGLVFAVYGFVNILFLFIYYFVSSWQIGIIFLWLLVSFIIFIPISCIVGSGKAIEVDRP